MRNSYLIMLCLFCWSGLYSQPVNDECLTAIHIPDTDPWCSDPGEFSNINATPFTGATPAPAGCFIQYQNEVWFTFRPQLPAVYIKVSGATNGLGTMKAPGMAVFEGPCNNLKRLGCSSSNASFNQTELSIADLVIGKVYYLVVESPATLNGTFQICIEGFIPPPSPQSDCDKAVILCDKSEFVVDTLLGIGGMDAGVNGSCVGQELSSAWYKWTAKTSGSLTFTLTPNDYQPGFESDDIDFVLFELPNGIENCNNKIELRCVAAGANGTGGQTDPFPTWQKCNGPTGLREGEQDVTEPAGCPNNLPNQNSFVDAVDVVAGRSYALMVNNFSQSGLGFSIEFGGTSTFQGPEPSFEIDAVQAFECDKTIIFSNESTAPTDSIVSYYWNFGAGATPVFDTTTGPISVVYESFGDKKVALTVTSDKGCVVTEILDFYVQPCCADTSTLDVSALITDQICPGTASGVIQGVGISGSPEYQFSLDCIDYQPASVFQTLLPGTYTLCIQDQKGCENQTEVVIAPASTDAIEAGDTIFVQLGETAQLNAVPFPTLPTTVMWNNQNTLTFPGNDIASLLRPLALPKRTGWYVVTVTNEFGCLVSDSVLIVVDAYKPIYIPNVFTPNGDGTNETVTVYGNNAATGVEVLQIYDRWGGLMYEYKDFLLNDESRGWDGTVNGKPVNPGVFSYRAVVNFLDEIPVVYTGTITVIR